MSTKFKFPKSKKIHEAIFEIAVDTHSLFCPFWQIFLPVYNLPSILASWIVLLFANLNSIDISIANVQVRICWTFYPSELPFPSWVLQYFLLAISSSMNMNYLFPKDILYRLQQSLKKLIFWHLKNELVKDTNNQIFFFCFQEKTIKVIIFRSYGVV